MENYIVIKEFFKLSEQKTYYIGDTIELSKEDAERFIKNGKVEKPKTVKAKK
jgi:hypothetical protein